MLPTPGALLTVNTPSWTNHLAGEPSCAETHWSRFLPSKSTMASEGGCAGVTPGVTTAGTGDHCSRCWRNVACDCCAGRAVARQKMEAKTKWGSGNFRAWVIRKHYTTGEAV